MNVRHSGIDGESRSEVPGRAAMTVGAEIAAFAASLTYEDLPKAVVAAAKNHLLDTLVVAYAGAWADGVLEILKLTEAESRPGPSTVWGHGSRLQPAPAALVNSMAAAALDYDSLCGTVHSDIVVVPAAMAVAEAERRSGREVLVAIVLGTEIMARLSRAATPPQKGWSHTGVFGAMGSALAASRLLRLSAEQIENAIGIGLSLTAGSQQSNIEQTLTKRLQPALASRHGIFAAQAALTGITGPRLSIEGRNGLWALYQDGDRDSLLSGLGRDYVLTRTMLKKYPVCACSHAAIEACLALVDKHRITSADVEEIEVTLTPFMAYMVGAAFDPSSNPVVAAQFSVRYAIASALLRGRVSLADLSLPAIRDLEIRRLAGRIALRIDGDVDGELAPSTVRIVSGRHGELTHTVSRVPGSAEAPLSSDERLRKLHECSDAIPSAAGRLGLDRIGEAVERVESYDDIAAFVRLLTTIDDTEN